MHIKHKLTKIISK